MSYPNTDTLMSPIQHGLAAVAAQVQGMGTVFAEVPAAAPPDNAAMFPFMGLDILDETNGKLRCLWHFRVVHVITQTDFTDDYNRLMTFLPPWLYALSAWRNTALDGAAYLVEPKKFRVGQYQVTDTLYLALLIDVDVSSEINIDLA